MDIGGITYPDDPLWLPDTGRLNDVGRDLLAVALGALEQQQLFGGGPGVSPVDPARYERTYVGHGSRASVPPSKANQLTVTLTNVAPGLAGSQTYSAPQGQPGRYAMQSAVFMVELSQPWPARQGPAPVKTTDVDAARERLWRDGLIVWAAFIALALGGVRAPSIPNCNDVAVGPMVPRDPNANVASWVIDVTVQL